MREFKFRVWSEEDNKMFYNEDIWFINPHDKLVRIENDEYNFIGGYAKEDEDLVLMQYTGIKDMYGKEIYEGDILEDKYGNVISKIAYNKGVFSVIEKHNRITDPIDYFATRKCVNGAYIKNMIVIGNIYENKDLLE